MFQVETADKHKKKIFKMTWRDNMSTRTEPKITRNEYDEEYTKITFKPDLKLFKMESLDGDIIQLMKKRVYFRILCLILTRFMILQELYHQRLESFLMAKEFLFKDLINMSTCTSNPNKKKESFPQ
jgi:DNA gyrase/topoisomerase IV subunit B